jgi:hypothetical protein
MRAKDKRHSERRQAHPRKVHHLDAEPLTIGAPEIGTPTLGQVHRLAANDLVLEPLTGKQTHQLKAVGIGVTQRRPGRDRAFEPEIEGQLRAALEADLRLLNELPQEGPCIKTVIKLLEKLGIPPPKDVTIVRKIVRPVRKKLKRPK